MGNPVQPLGILVPPLGKPVPLMGKPVPSLGNPMPALVLLGQPVDKRRPRCSGRVHQGEGAGTPGEEMDGVPRSRPRHSLTQRQGIMHQSPSDTGSVSWERVLPQLFQALA